MWRAEKLSTCLLCTVGAILRTRLCASCDTAACETCNTTPCGKRDELAAYLLFTMGADEIAPVVLVRVHSFFVKRIHMLIELDRRRERSVARRTCPEGSVPIPALLEQPQCMGDLCCCLGSQLGPCHCKKFKSHLGYLAYLTNVSVHWCAESETFDAAEVSTRYSSQFYVLCSSDASAPISDRVTA